MSKYKPKIYAKVLVDLILDRKNTGEDKNISDKFLRYLEKNRDIKKVKEIITLAENLYFKKTGERKITLESARKIDVKDIPKNILKDKDFLEKKINKDLIAGIKIVINSENQLDFSLQNKLEKVFR